MVNVYKSTIFCLLTLIIIAAALATTNPLFIPPSPANSEVVTGNVTLNFSFNGTINYTITLNNGTITQLCAANETSGSPTTCLWDTSTYPEDQYTITLNATQSTNASNSSEATILNVFVEQPIEPSFLSPANNSNLSGIITINFTYSTRADFDLYYSTGGGWTSLGCTGNNLLPPQSCVWDTTGVSDNANYMINITAEDFDNATDIGYALLGGLTIDNTNPSTTLLAPSNDTVFNTSTVTFNWTASDTIDTNTTCNLTINGAPNATYGNETNSTERVMSDGSHTWGVSCADYTGNTNTTAIFTFLVDTTTPTVTQANVTPLTSTNYTNATPALSILVEEASLVSCAYHIGDNNWTALTSAALGGDLFLCSGSMPVQSDSTTLNISVNITDAANNTLVYPIVNVSIDAIAPTLNITSPQNNTYTSDGESFFVNATVIEEGSNIINGANCTVTIGGFSNSTTGSVNYNASRSACQGTLTFKDPSELTTTILRNALVVSVNDSVNNTGSNRTDLLADNLGPGISTSSTNLTNDVTTNASQVFLISILTFDNSPVESVIVGNATNLTLSNTSAISNGTFITWTGQTNATGLGCPSVGLCEIQIYANDSWSNTQSNTPLSLVVDADSPQYTNAAVNTTGPIGLKEAVLLSAQWSDESLNAASSTTASLYKYQFNTSSFAVVESINLNSTLSWSNFTYIPIPAYDEGRNMTFYINYTDFAGRSNQTPNLTFTVTNSTPIPLSVEIVGLVSNVSNESPIISMQYADLGTGAQNSDVILSIEGNGQEQNSTKNSWTCAVLSTYNDTSAAIGETLTFSTSSYGATNYSFYIRNITQANSSAASVIIERVDYARTNTTNLSGWGDTYEFEDIRITLVSTTNVSTSASLGFTDTGYEEIACNTTISTLGETAHNATLYVTDERNNTNNTGTSWLVDYVRPTFINLSANDEFIIQDSSQIASIVNVTDLVDETLNISFAINETYMNLSRVFIDGNLLFSDALGNTYNETLISLAPGHHEVVVDLRDITYASTSTIVNETFEVFLNNYANITALASDLNASLAAINGAVQIRSGSDISNEENYLLNDTVGLHMALNISNTNITVDVGEINGLLYNWNNTFSADISNSSSLASSITARSGVSTQKLVRFINYTATEDYAKFLPESQTQPTNWTIDYNASFVLLFSDENASSLYLLDECSSAINPTSFAESCFSRNASNITIFAPILSGIVLGNDSGAPNITVQTPSSTAINDSSWTLSFNVSEPSPASGTFCTYRLDNLTNPAALIDSDTLLENDFTLTGASYVFTQEYDQFRDGVNYSLNITCTDSFGNSANSSTAFTVDDEIAPTVTQINNTLILVDDAILSVSSNEYARFRLNYSTSEGDLSTQTNWTEYGTLKNISLTNVLSPNTRYYYRVQACDINGQCSIYPETNTFAGTFRTSEISASESSSGGGGGGAGLVEGMVIASHFHGWSELPTGWLRYKIDKEDIALTGINIFLENETKDAFVEVKTYYGKPNGVPRAQPLAYQYFHLNHARLVSVASEFEIEFKVSDSWFEANNATQIHFFRLEDDVWIEYAASNTATANDHTYYTVKLPGISYFVITADVPKQTENTTYVPPITGEIIEQPDSQPPPAQNDNNESTTIVEYASEQTAWWIYALMVLVLVGLGGGAYYFRSQQERQILQTPIQLDTNDPFYELQQYIQTALIHGHTQNEIREKLLDAGWDDIVIDEEIEKIMTDQLSS